jgi:hypothetical protein
MSTGKKYSLRVSGLSEEPLRYWVGVADLDLEPPQFSVVAETRDFGRAEQIAREVVMQGLMFADTSPVLVWDSHAWRKAGLYRAGMSAP